MSAYCCVNLDLFINSTPLFLKLGSAEPQGSAKGCQGCRETKMRNGRRVLLAVLNLYVWTKVYVATFDANHSVTDSRQTITCCINPEATALCSQVSQHILP